MHVRILMVCLGNICRSTMAEYVMRECVRRAGLDGQIMVESAGTSSEELGNPVYPGTRRVLAQHGIPCGNHRAVQLRRADYERFDFIVGMDEGNMRSMRRIFGSDPENKLHLLLDWSSRPRPIADPWYTGDFETTYTDVSEGCEALLAWLRSGEL